MSESLKNWQRENVILRMNVDDAEAGQLSPENSVIIQEWGSATVKIP